VNAFMNDVRLDTATRQALIEATEPGTGAVSIYLRGLVRADVIECVPAPDGLCAIPKAWTRISPGVARVFKDLRERFGEETWTEPSGKNGALEDEWTGTPDGFHGLPAKPAATT